MKNKDKVYVKIKGLHREEQDEEVEVINVGTYGILNGKEYIKYDEVYDGESQKGSSIIKIDDNLVEVTKKGAVATHMSFELGKKTTTYYDTPYGNLYLGIYTRSMNIDRTEDKIEIHLEYSMDLNYEQISESEINIEITTNKPALI